MVFHKNRMTRRPLAVGALVMVTMRFGSGHIALRRKAASENQGIQHLPARGLERKLHWRHTDDGTDDYGTTDDYYGTTDDYYGTADDYYRNDGDGTTDDDHGTDDRSTEDAYRTDDGATDDAYTTYDGTTDDFIGTDEDDYKYSSSSGDDDGDTSTPTAAPTLAQTASPTFLKGGSSMPPTASFPPIQMAPVGPITGAPVGITSTPVAAPTPELTQAPVRPQTPTPALAASPTPVVVTERPVAPETTPPGLDAEMEMLLELHNAARCIHGADPLSWSSEVASVAQSWAEHLTSSSGCDLLAQGELTHSTSEQRNGYGENLYVCWGSTAGCFSSENAMNGLYLEELTNGPVTEYGGHATQILWKSSTELGCAVESCSTGSDDVDVLVCNYNPPGNYNDMYLEEVEQPSKSAEECGYP